MQFKYELNDENIQSIKNRFSQTCSTKILIAEHIQKSINLGLLKHVVDNAIDKYGQSSRIVFDFQHQQNQETKQIKSKFKSISTIHTQNSDEINDSAKEAIYNCKSLLKKINYLVQEIDIIKEFISNNVNAHWIILDALDKKINHLTMELDDTKHRFKKIVLGYI